MSTDSQRQLFSMHADVCKALSNPVRLEILNELRAGEKTVTQLARSTGLPQPLLSQHLSLLKSMGVVVARKAGKNVHYQLFSPKIMQACDLMRHVLVQRLRHAGKSVQKVKK